MGDQGEFESESVSDGILGTGTPLFCGASWILVKEGCVGASTTVAAKVPLAAVGVPFERGLS